MTKNNEQIINANECEHFCEGECWGGYKFKYCKDNENCHFKQYLRKEQECEELKDKLNCRFCYPIIKIDDPENFKLCQETDCFRRQLDQLKKEKEKLEDEISHYEHDLGWCSSLIDLYEEKLMKTFYALHQIQLHNLKIKDKDIHLILKEVKEDLKEYNKMKNEELDKKVKDE